MDTDVLIVGAGPTGLMLAGFLTRQGIRPLVIDKKQGLTEAQSRALIVVPRTLETYDMLGIVERTLKPHLQVYGALSPEVEAFAPQHPEFPLTRFSFTPEAARAGLQAGACYLLRPDGYVAYAASRFSSEELLAFLRDAWGWREVEVNVEKEAPA